MSGIEVIKITDTVYLLDDEHKSTGYIVIGSEKACLIDTMNGENDPREVIKDITDKPLVVVNTHGHPDHIFGNIYFDEVLIHEADLELANSFTDTEEMRDICERKGRKMCTYKFIKGGDVIDLGDKKLEIFDIPGHTPGGILLLLEDERILFAGDSINHHLWMQLDGSSSIEEYVGVLDSLMFLEERADHILHGHARGFDDISLMKNLRDGAQSLVDGNTLEDSDYEWFEGVAKQHPFKVIEDEMNLNIPPSVICYQENNVKRKEIRTGLGELMMTVHVKVTEVVSVRGGSMEKVMVAFTGKAEGRYFEGETVGSCVDTQTYSKDSSSLSARYMLEGKDYTGQECSIFVDNSSCDGGIWRPVVVTDSKALADWENSELKATVDPAPEGVTVRVYK